ncbi:unnamed protein product [Prunus armeniaca]|nr:hypothetical protein GBA52_008187 [Prunus armeniaca]
MFTVKSAYHVARSLHSPTGKAFSSNPDVVARNWSLIWKAIVPARVKTFWWRVISGILPTKANLARKKVSLDEECMFYEGPTKSSIHILRDCPCAICAWRSSTLSSSWWNNDAYSPKDWVFCCAEQLSCHDFANFLMVGWAIWEECNGLLWNNKKSRLEQVSLHASLRPHDFLWVNNCLGSQSRQGQMKQMWQPPHENTLKINVDGAWKPGTTEGGVSVVVRDSIIKFVVGCATNLTNVFSAPQA